MGWSFNKEGESNGDWPSQLKPEQIQARIFHDLSSNMFETHFFLTYMFIWYFWYFSKIFHSKPSILGIPFMKTISCQLVALQMTSPITRRVAVRQDVAQSYVCELVFRQVNGFWRRDRSTHQGTCRKHRSTIGQSWLQIKIIQNIIIQ